MAGEVIQVEFQALLHASGSLSTKAKALDGHMEQLQRSLTPIKQSWYSSGSSSGEAAQAAETRLRAAIGEIIKIIGQFSVKVHEAHGSLVSLENRHASFF